MTLGLLISFVCQLLYILQQILGVKVSDKFFLLWCFLGPEITYNIHFLCIIL